MNDLVVSLGSLIVGVVASVWVSAYYFRRSLTKSLTPYVQFSSKPFQGISADVRKALQVTYAGVAVEDLYEVQFVIANTGDKAIRDLIEPLALAVPEKSVLLDAAVLHAEPQELKTKLKIPEDRRSIFIDFPLLNRGDFFVLKVLLNGAPKLEELKFSILVDELPRQLPAQRLEFDAIANSKKREMSFPLLGFGLVMILFGLALFKVVFDAWTGLPSTEGGIIVFLSRLTIGAVATWLVPAPAFILTLIGAMMSAAALFDGSFPPRKKKFVLPENLARTPFRAMIREGDVES